MVGAISRVVKAHSKRTDVIRTSIPAGVRHALNLEAGDVLEWVLLPRGDTIIAEVRKVMELRKKERLG